MTASPSWAWWQRLAVGIARLDDHGFPQQVVVLAFAFLGSLALSPLGLAGAVVGAIGAVFAHLAVERYGHRLLVGFSHSAGSREASSAVEGVLVGASSWLRPDRLRDARLMLQAGVLDQALLVVLSDMTTIQSTSEEAQETLLAAARALGPTREVNLELERLGLGRPGTN